ncbi:MAG: uracil-DNA glycosylase [Bacteroidales bacterium]
MGKSVFLDSVNINPSWNSFLTPDIIKLLSTIEREIGSSNYTPPSPRVLNFLSVPLEHVKIIILGQDPYPQQGVATGRAFEVGTLKSWNQPFNNISLKNIVRAIYYAYKNEYLKFSEIKKLMGSSLQIKNPDELFVEWEKQGVLLLNTSFTCETGKSNSHEKYWGPFTLKLLHNISENHPNIIWFLWGNNAKEIVSGLNLKHKFETMHPMMCYNAPGRDDDFLFGKTNPFAETKNIINWLG